MQLVGAMHLQRECICIGETLPAGMNPSGRNHPCSIKEHDKDAMARGKARHDMKKTRKIPGKDQKKTRKSPGQDRIKQRLQKQYLHKEGKQGII